MKEYVDLLVRETEMILEDEIEKHSVLHSVGNGLERMRFKAERKAGNL